MMLNIEMYYYLNKKWKIQSFKFIRIKIMIEIKLKLDKLLIF